MPTAAAAKTASTKPVLSPEDKKARRVEKLAKEKLEREAEQKRLDAERNAYMDALPLKLLGLMARVAKRHDVEAEVQGDGTMNDLLRVQFRFPDPYSHRGEKDEVLVYVDCYSNDIEWRVDNVTERLDAMDAADAEELRLLEVARTTYDALTEDQRTALGLTRRP